MTHDSTTRSPFDVTAPMAQAARCLDLWLREENKRIDPVKKSRLSALLARYFLYEEDRSDALILSFLRHYSGRSAVDLDDPAHIRQEIKKLLDQAENKTPDKNMMIAAGLIACAVLSTMAFYPVATKTITEHQAEDLRRQVAELARSAAPPRATATIWADIKRELNVRRYEDISYWDYDEAKDILKRLKTGQPRG